MGRMVNLFYRIVKSGKKQFTAPNIMRGFFTVFGSSLLMIGLAIGFAESAAAQKGTKTITSPSGASVEISEWSDGANYSKYLVRKTGDPGSRQFWYSQYGSANSGANEAGRKTSQQEWCRVRYLYGDNVRIAPCWGAFMYSSHLITGIDGLHYELWFSPSSLSYFKIRNQETGVWYAHDGSANDGKVRTTKEDWCRVIFYHMSGILKSPNECKDFNNKFVNAIAGISGPAAQRAETTYVKTLLGTVETHAVKVGGAATGTVIEEVVGKVAENSIEKFSTARSGLFKNVGTGAKGMLKEAGTGLVVGIAVDYGVDALKNKLGWQAKDANAGMIAAEVITTTVASSAISTGIMLAAGASFNPVLAGVGLLVGGGIAAGEEIAKASKDTGITFEKGYTSQSRYNRDLNGIGSDVFAHNNPPGTFEWVNCGKENERCTFDGIRSVRYGAGDKFVEIAAVNGVDCNNTTFGKDPAPNTAKTCVVQTFPMDGVRLVKQSNNPAVYIQKKVIKKDLTTIESYCILQNMGIVNAYGLAFREVPALNLTGTNDGMCAIPNGFYKLDKTPTIWYAYGDVTPLPNGKILGDKYCAIPNLDILKALGGEGNFMTLPPGSDITRYRNDTGVCDLKNFTEPQTFDWEECAKESGRCTFEGTRSVRYGAGNSFIELAFSDGADCTNAAFGRDPAPGLEKTCTVKIPDGSFDGIECAKENGRCTFEGTRLVRYGAGDKILERAFYNGADCNNTAFGRDPAPGVAKTCVVQKRKPAGNFDWDDCAKENGKCSFYGVRLVRYGAGDKFVEGGFFNGVQCDTNTFGKDPAPGVAKTCVVQTFPMDRYYLVRKIGDPTIYFQQGKEQYCGMPSAGILDTYSATYKEVSSLNLTGRDNGTCGVANGFYRLDKTPTIWYAYGDGIKLGNGKVIGDKFCAVPNPTVLNALGGSNFTTLPPGSDITRYRKDTGACTAP